MKQTLTLLVLFTPGLFFTAFSQSWSNLQQWGGTGTEVCSALAVDKRGAIWMAGSFENQISFGNQVLNAIGEEDIFLCQLNIAKEIVWAKKLGSRAEDEVADVTLDGEDNLLITGTYWLEGEFDTIKLTAGLNPKAIFIAKYHSQGRVLWAKTLNGTGLKGIGDIVCDKGNNIWVTGFFEKNIEIGDTILTAKGITDLFLAKFSRDGQFLWALQQGQKGDTRGTAIGLTTNREAIVAGYFNDSTKIADTVLVANTLDQDAFIARFDQNGVPIWAKKAGGVFDCDVTELVLDEQNNIFLTGYFVGVMRLSPSLSIQSSSGNSDFFLLKYQEDGTPLQARALGGSLLEQALDLAIQNNILLISGFHQGNMTLDGFTLSAGNTLNGFVAGFDLNLQTQWAKQLASDAFLYASQVEVAENQDILVGGSFTGRANLDALSATANSFDVFLATLAPSSTATRAPSQQILFRVFPNPTDGQVNIQTEVPQFFTRVTNAAGQVVLENNNASQLDFSQLPKGIYYITFRMENTSQTYKIIWQ